MRSTTLVLALGVAGLCLFPAQADVFINELTMRPLGQNESVELFNAGTDTVDASGWEIQGSKGTYTLPTPTLLPGGTHVEFAVGDIQGERGGATALIDIVDQGDGPLRTTLDEVTYGEDGSAPLPPAGMSLTRAPDAAFALPPAPDPQVDGLVWTIDLSPTFPAPNDAPDPELGSSLLINEFDPTPVGGGDLLELYNPSGAPIDIEEWFLINGDGIMFLTGIVPAGGFLVIPTDPGFDLDEIGLIYLFRADGVRIDQIGFHDAPDLGPGECYGRCPDGAEPYLGFDYASSGGDETFLIMDCSLGASNEPCGGTSVEGVSWGYLKERFR